MMQKRQGKNLALAQGHRPNMLHSVYDDSSMIIFFTGNLFIMKSYTQYVIRESKKEKQRKKFKKIKYKYKCLMIGELRESYS